MIQILSLFGLPESLLCAVLYVRRICLAWSTFDSWYSEKQSSVGLITRQVGNNFMCFDCSHVHIVWSRTHRFDLIMIIDWGWEEFLLPSRSFELLYLADQEYK